MALSMSDEAGPAIDNIIRANTGDWLYVRTVMRMCEPLTFGPIVFRTIFPPCFVDWLSFVLTEASRYVQSKRREEACARLDRGSSPEEGGKSLSFLLVIVELFLEICNFPWKT